MTKEKQVTLNLDARAAAAVRQVLFDAQKGYTNDILTTPLRIFELREVIADLDDSIELILNT